MEGTPRTLPNLLNSKGDSVVRKGAYQMNSSIGRWVREHARLSPNRTAIVAPDQRISYQDLNARADRAANLLHGRLGLRQGDRLAVYTLNCPEWFEVLIAAARLGLIVVPLNTRLTPAELQYQLEDSGCTSMVCGEEFWGVLPALLAITAVSQVVAIGFTAPLLLPGVEVVAYEGAVTTQTPPPDAARDADPLLIVYTSGTTGKPKGAVLTHGNMLYNALNNGVGLGITAEDITLTVLPLFHVGGIGLFSLPALYAGASIVLPRRFDPAEALRLIERERVTFTMTVPTIMQAYLDALDQMASRPDLSSCRGFISGGAPCPTELIAAASARGLPFGQGYGMTETAPTVFLQPEMQLMRNLATGQHIGRPGRSPSPQTASSAPAIWPGPMKMAMSRSWVARRRC
jgi:fatty-acyl-CoA synthase